MFGSICSGRLSHGRMHTFQRCKIRWSKFLGGTLHDGDYHKWGVLIRLNLVALHLIDSRYSCAGDNMMKQRTRRLDHYPLTNRRSPPILPFLTTWRCGMLLWYVATIFGAYSRGWRRSVRNPMLGDMNPWIFTYFPSSIEAHCVNEKKHQHHLLDCVGEVCDFYGTGLFCSSWKIGIYGQKTYDSGVLV